MNKKQDEELEWEVEISYGVRSEVSESVIIGRPIASFAFNSSVREKKKEKNTALQFCI